MLGKGRSPIWQAALVVCLVVVAASGAYYFGRKSVPQPTAAATSPQPQNLAAPTVRTVVVERAVTAPVAASPHLDPRTTLDRVIQASLRGPNNAAAQREIIHLLETLVEQGDRALPALGEFLVSFQDAEFPAMFSEARRWVRGSREREPLLAPTLRLAVMEVVARINSPASENLLADIMQQTGRGIELVYAPARGNRSGQIQNDRFAVCAPAHPFSNDQPEPSAGSLRARHSVFFSRSK
jgi:hypothetical protein